MKSLDRILVPVDFGPNTDAVVDIASKLAAGFGAKFKLLYVIEQVPQFPAALDLLKQGASERLKHFEDRVTGQGVECEPSMYVVGNPFDVIVRVADSSNAHLIVMGRGRSCDDRHPGLGNTTSRVMRRTAHPVITVATGSSSEIRRILCPVDCSSTSGRGLRNAIELAARLKARLTVMSVLAELAPSFGLARRPDMAKVASDYQKMEREQFARFIEGFDLSGLDWDKEVHSGHPADEIVRLANDAKYDLVVMGSTGRSGLPRVLLGSTAETVTRRVACPVLTLKREDVLSARLEAELADLNRLLAEGNELMDEERYDEAIGRFDQCLLKDPYFIPAIEGLANVHERLGHETQAADLRGQAALIRQQLWRQQPAEQAAIH